MKVLIKNFQKMCTPEGKVSKVEFKKVIEAHFGGGDPTLTRMILMTFDKDGNAEIDFREFVLAMAYVMNTNLDNSIDIAFASMDLNGDGGVTRDELRAVFRTQARLHKYINVYKREKNLDEIVLVPSETVDIHDQADRLYEGIQKQDPQKITKEEFMTAVQSSTELSRLVAQLMAGVQETKTMFS